MLASTLLGEDPPSMPVRRLVRVAALFGINDNQARVALSRMAARGEVVADGAGGYALAGPLLDRAARIAVARSAVTGPFDGTWHVVVVTARAGPAAVRRARRDALRAARLGELRDGVWLRPANLEVGLGARTEDAVTLFSARPSGDARALAASVFDLEGWARRARVLLEELGRTRTGEQAGLAEGFVTSAEILRHLQRDPLLPDELAPLGWPGAELRARQFEFDAAFRSKLAALHRAGAASEPTRS